VSVTPYTIFSVDVPDPVLLPGRQHKERGVPLIRTLSSAARFFETGLMYIACAGRTPPVWLQSPAARQRRELIRYVA